MQEQFCTSYIYLAKPLSKVHVCNNRSNTDYDPQDILSHSRMVTYATLRQALRAAIVHHS